MPPHKSHPLLAIFMHHFGCAIPTHESLTILRLVAAGRTIADVGSGNGYWTMMLRAYGIRVIPVDSAQSEWRVNWLDDLSCRPPPPPPSSSSSVNSNGNGNGNGNDIGIPGGPTVLADGAKWLSSQKSADEQVQGNIHFGPGSGNDNSGSKPSPRHKLKTSSKSTTDRGEGDIQKGGKDLVLLIVYPVVGPDGTGSFTRSLMAAYAGDTVAVVGTQNHNGYTGFKNMVMDEYMEREHGSSGWQRVVRIPLPSFPRKDEALFVFQRRG